MVRKYQIEVKIKGKININRSMHGDIVAVELLSEDCNKKKIFLLFC